MFNKVILVGNLTRDIELRYSQSGMGIAKTGIATNRRYKKQSGEQVDETMFIDITFFGRSAEIANQYLRKGSKILVEGRLILEQWVDQNGGKRSRHSVTVDEMKMLDSRGDAQNMGAPMDQGGYDAPQDYGQGGGYNNQQPQRSYPNSYQQPQQSYQQPKPQNSMPENTIPEIDIDEDEIPF